MRPQVIAFIFESLVLVKKAQHFKGSVSLSSGSYSQATPYKAEWTETKLSSISHLRLPILEKITGSRSPETQKCNIQEIDEDKRITCKIYHFESCGTVYMDSLNAHYVKIKNCGNNVPNVTCSLFLSFSPHFCSHCQPTWPYHIMIQITVLGLLAMGKFTLTILYSLQWYLDTCAVWN